MDIVMEKINCGLMKQTLIYQKHKIFLTEGIIVVDFVVIVFKKSKNSKN